MTIFKQDKGKGTSPVSNFAHHPATAGWYGKNTAFAVAKVWFSSFPVWGQFLASGPYPETTIFGPGMVKIRPPVKNWVFYDKSGELKLADLLRKLKDYVGNRSGIRCCGLLFGWVAFRDPASFIPLNRGFHKNSQFSII